MKENNIKNVSPINGEDNSIEKTIINKSDKECTYGALFGTFCKIGAFTLGGGYAMIPIIEEEVVNKHKWIEKDEFVDIIAVAQSCPGVFAANISIFVGYKLRKTLGAICACIGAIIPSFIVILCIAMFFSKFQENKLVAAIFRGIRPAVVALIAAPTFRLAAGAHLNLMNCWIPIVCALLIWLLHVNPIFILLAAAIGGYLYGRFIKPTEGWDD